MAGNFFSAGATTTSSSRSSNSVSTGAGGVFAVAKHVKLLLDLRYNLFRKRSWQNSTSMFGITYAIRIHSGPFGGDIGFIRPFLAMNGTTAYTVEDVMRYMPMGYPFLSFTYQW